MGTKTLTIETVNQSVGDSRTDYCLTKQHFGEDPFRAEVPYLRTLGSTG